MSDDDQDASVYPFTPPPPSALPGNLPGGRRPRHSRLTKTAAGLAVILGTGAGAAAVAVTTTSGGPSALASASATTGAPSATTDVTSNATMPAGPVRRAFFGGRGGPLTFAQGVVGAGGFGPLGANGVIHASYTVKAADGTYKTIDTQVGTAEAVSSSSITVKSADGFSQTYDVATTTTVDADYEGILSVKQGDTVSIQATVDGSTITATQVVDVTQVQANAPSPIGPSWQVTGPNAAPAPVPSATTTLPSATTTLPSATTTLPSATTSTTPTSTTSPPTTTTPTPAA